MYQVTLNDYQEFLEYRHPSDYVYLTANEIENLVWVLRDDIHGYEMAEIIESDGDYYTVKGRITESVRQVHVDDVHGVNPSKFDGVADCAELGDLSEPAVLHNLKLRYDNKRIYTYSGLFLVAINPYIFFPIYTDEMIEMYEGKRRDELAPHVYAVSDETYRVLISERQSQSILITGESGAGKTENTKRVIQYLASIAGNPNSGEQNQGKLEQQLLQCNPLLEAIGNAKTNKNNNSSRFGKFIKITFGDNGYISGASVDSYLLEKSRVIHQLANERNFHIFYQMMAGLSSDRKLALGLTKAEDYAYLNQSGCYSVDDMDDFEEFQATMQALETLDFSPEEIDTIFEVCACILHLGNLKFVGDEQAELDPSSKALLTGTIANLLKVSAEELESALLTPRIKAGRDLIKRSLTPHKAANSRDALCKALYGRMFLWVVEKINRTLKVHPTHNFIGILDIAGFEIFDYNSFEQLCINFTNERLQQFFNNHMFNLEQEEYRRENIEWNPINFGVDSQATIDLIQKSPKGILLLLDEESIMQRDNATEEEFMEKLEKNAGRHPKFRKEVTMDPLEFSIVHYAGEVTYHTADWLEKNKDPLQSDIEVCIKASKNKNLARFFALYSLNKDGQEATRSTARRTGALNTVAAQYRNQLNDLINTLLSTTPHFIRCIIPNHTKTPLVIDDEIVLDQLSCNGVLEGIKISRMGYPNRLKYQVFLKRYWMLGEGIPRAAPDSRSAVNALVNQLAEKDICQLEKIQFGRSKIFFKVGELSRIEEAREKFVANIIPTIQANIRGYISRKLYKKKNESKFAAIMIQRNVRAWLIFKNWNWYRLFLAARPKLVKVDQGAIIKEAQAKVEALQKELEKELQNQEKLTQTMLQLQEIYNRLKDELKTQESSLNDLLDKIEANLRENSRFDNQIDDLKEQHEAQDKELRQTENLVREVRNRIKETENQLSKTNSTAKNLLADKKKLEQDLTNLHALLEAEEETIQKNKSIARELDLTLEELEEDLELEKTTVNSLNNLKDDLQTEIANLNDQKEVMSRKKQDIEKRSGKLSDEAKELNRSVEEVASAIGLLNNNMSKVKSQINDIESEIDNVIKEKNVTIRANNSLDDRIGDLQSEVDDVNSEVSQLNRKIKSTMEDIALITNSHADEIGDVKELQGITSRLESSVVEYKHQLEDVESRISKGTREKNQLGVDLENAHFTLDQYDQRLSNAERDNKKLTIEIEELDVMLNKVDTDIAKNDKIRKNLENNIKGTERELTSLKDQVERLTSDNRKVAQDLDAVSYNLQTEKNYRDKFAKERRDLEAKVSAKETELENLEGDIGDMIKRLKDADLRLSDLVDEVEGLANTRNNFDVQRNQCENTIATAQKDLSILQDNRTQLESNLRQLETDLSEASLLLNTAEKKFNALSGTSRKQESDIEDLNDTNNDLSRSINKMGKVLKKSQNELRELQKRANEARQNGSSLQGTLTTLQDQTERLSKEIEELERVLSSLEKANQQLSYNIAELEDQQESALSIKSKLERRVQQLQDEIEETGETAVTQATIEEYERMIHELDGEYESIKRSLDKEMEMRISGDNAKKMLLRSIDDCKVEIEDAQKSIAVSERNRKKIANDLEDANRELAKINASVKDLESRIKKAEKEERFAKASASRAGNLVDDDELRRAQQEISQLQDNLERETAQKLAAEQRVRELAGDLTDIKEMVEDELTSKEGLLRHYRSLLEEINYYREHIEDLEDSVRYLSDIRFKKDFEINQIRRQLDLESETRDKFEQLSHELERELIDGKRTLETERRLTAEAERLRRRIESKFQELKLRLEQEDSIRSRADKEKIKILKEIRLLREEITILSADKDEQERISWKLQDEVDSLVDTLNREHRKKTKAAKLIKHLEVQCHEFRETAEEAALMKTKSEAVARDLQLEIEELRDRLTEEQDRNFELRNSQNEINEITKDIQRGLQREISARESIETEKRALDRDNQVMSDAIDEERVRYANLEREVKRTIVEVEDTNARLDLLSNSVQKALKAKELAEEQLFSSRKLLKDIKRSLGQEIAERESIENEFKKLQELVTDEEDRAAEAESDQRRAEVELAQLREEYNYLLEELEKAKTDAHSATLEKDDLDEKVRSVAGIMN